MACRYYNAVLKPLAEAKPAGDTLMAACGSFARPSGWDTNLAKLNELTEANHRGDHDRVSQLEVRCVPA